VGVLPGACGRPCGERDPTAEDDASSHGEPAGRVLGEKVTTSCACIGFD